MSGPQECGELFFPESSSPSLCDVCPMTSCGMQRYARHVFEWPSRTSRIIVEMEFPLDRLCESQCEGPQHDRVSFSFSLRMGFRVHSLQAKIRPGANQSFSWTDNLNQAGG